MDEKHERQLRRQAIRLWLQGVKPKSILKKVQRSYVWLSKWRKRFEQAGSQGLHSDSRRPHTTPRAFPVRVVRLILRTRRRLVKQVAGLIGPRAIRRELRKVLGPHAPSLTTIKRVLQTHHVIPVLAKPVYFPKPLTTVAGVLHALDWTCRYLEDGPKVYAFHTLNLRTRACAQTIATDKSGPTVIGHCLTTWKTLGIPDFLQLDNDAAFCGGYKAPRIFGQFVRLCLYLGIELIFLPVAEPKRNGEIEEFNGLWGGAAFWERHHFASVRHVARLSPKFIDWYLTDYAPPALEGLTPQASATPGTQTPADRHPDGPSPNVSSHYCRSRAFHSPGQTRWHDRRVQRNLEGEQTVSRPIRLGHPHHSSPAFRNLVSTRGATGVVLAQDL